MLADTPAWSPREQAERDHLAYLCDVAACLATIAWQPAEAPQPQVRPEPIVGTTWAVTVARQQLRGAA